MNPLREFISRETHGFDGSYTFSKFPITQSAYTGFFIAYETTRTHSSNAFVYEFIVHEIHKEWYGIVNVSIMMVRDVFVGILGEYVQLDGVVTEEAGVFPFDNHYIISW